MKTNVSSNRPNLFNSIFSFFYEKRVRQTTTYENWIKKILIFLMIGWMLTTVFLPLNEVLDRSLNAEITVAIFGEDDVRIGGRRIHFDDGELKIDGKVIANPASPLKFDGIYLEHADDAFSSVTSTRVKYFGDLLDVEPINVRIDGDSWYIEGNKLGEEDWNKTIRRWIGFRNFKQYFTNDNLYLSLFHSLFVAFVSTLIAVSMALLYAYAINRSQMRGKSFFQIVAMLPLFAPTMLYGLSLVYLFGNKGLITTGFLGVFPFLSFDVGLYGPVGIIIAEIVFTFPAAFMILTVALSSTDARLYEAALTLGASRARIFWTVTIPGIKFGLMSAVFVCFTLAFTDFGAPKIVGGNYNILAVDIYKQVIGQQNFGMGSTISIILLIPALIAFVADRIIQRKKVVAMTASSVPYTAKKAVVKDNLLFAACVGIAGFILLMLFTAGFGSLVKMWPYDFTLGLQHYSFKGVGGGGYSAFWNSVRMSFYTAVFGTIITFFSAYLIEKTRGMNILRGFSYLLSIIPLALPGLVIGIAYIFFFNKSTISLPFIGVEVFNPFHSLYGTMAILVISNVIHFYTVSFLTATTALRQLDKEFETVSESMSVPFYKTFLRVTIPVSLPAILEVAMYYFVSSMATVSAVIFLYSSDNSLASVAVINMDDAGDTAPAAAMCMLIILMNIGVRVLFEVVTKYLKKSTQSWRTR